MSLGIFWVELNFTKILKLSLNSYYGSKKNQLLIFGKGVGLCVLFDL